MRGGYKDNHNWCYAAGRWQCTRCFTAALTDEAKQRRAKERCKRRSDKIEQVFAAAQDYSLAVAETAERPVILCVAHGAWCTIKPLRLLEPCKGLRQGTCWLGGGRCAAARWAWSGPWRRRRRSFGTMWVLTAPMCVATGHDDPIALRPAGLSRPRPSGPILVERSLITTPIGRYWPAAGSDSRELHWWPR